MPAFPAPGTPVAGADQLVLRAAVAAGRAPLPALHGLAPAVGSWSAFYRVCVIDNILPHSPADYFRRPTVPAESPTLGLGHLQFEALSTTARLSTNPNDFALVALLGLLGL